MDPNVDSQLIINIVDSLKSSKSDSILSTLEFLETVVIFDFPSKALFYQRDLFTHLLKLCGDPLAEIRNVATSCVETMCRNVITQHKRKHEPKWMIMTTAVPVSDSQDKAHIDSLTICGTAYSIGKCCHDLVINSKCGFDAITKLLNAASELVLILELQSQILEFCKVLANILTVLRIGERQNYITVFMIFTKCVEQCSVTSFTSEIISEIDRSFLDASIFHFHPELLESFSPILKKIESLSEKFERIMMVFEDFKYLTRFLTNPDENGELVRITNLVQLPDSNLSEFLLEVIFKHFKKFGGEPAIIISLLCQREEVVRRVVEQLVILVSPVQNASIGSNVASLVVDERVVQLLKERMVTDKNSEKVLSLIVKGQRWMECCQWQGLVQNIIPHLILDVEPKLESYQILAPILWDLISQTALPSDGANNQPERLDLNFVIRFLLRNLLRNGSLQDRCSQNLVTILLQQPSAQELHPRMSRIDTNSFLFNLDGDSDMLLNSTAVFETETLLEILKILESCTDLTSCRSDIIQLAIVLEDIRLHPLLVQKNGRCLLTQLLHRSLRITAADVVCVSVVSSIATALLLVATHSADVCKDLAEDNQLLLNLVRARILTNEDVIGRRYTTALLKLLAGVGSTPTTAILVNPLQSDTLIDLWSQPAFRWSSKFVFNAEWSTLRDRCSLPAPMLRMSGADLSRAKAANDIVLMEEGLAAISSVHSHSQLEVILSMLREVILRPGVIGVEILDLDWRKSFQQFFRVLPESESDQLVFADILHTLVLCVTRNWNHNDRNEETELFQWIFYVLMKRSHPFWVLFDDQCILRNRLWPSLLRFVSTISRLAATSSSCNSGSLNHVIRMLSKALDREAEAEVYELSSLKLILDCLVHTTAASIRLKDGPEVAVIQKLVPKVTGIIVSFGSQKNGSQKGRCVVQSCAQLMCNMMNLVPVLSIPPNWKWLLLLLQYPDPIVRTSGLQCCLITENPELINHIKEVVVDILENPEDVSFVLHQSALLLSQHPHLISSRVLNQVCRIMTGSSIQHNQPLLEALLKLLTSSLSIKELVPVIVEDIIPVLPPIWASGACHPEVKAGVAVLLTRAVLVYPELLSWLLKHPECVSTFAECLLSPHRKLVESSAFYLALLLNSGEHPVHVIHSTLRSSPNLQNVLSLIRTYPDVPSCTSLLLFLQSFLIVASGCPDLSFQLQPDQVALFARWLLPNLPTGSGDPLRKNSIQLLGLVLLFCRETEAETVESVCDFLVKEIKFDQKSVVPIEVAHNLILYNGGCETRLLPAMIDSWKVNSRATPESTNILKHLINFLKLTVAGSGRDSVIFLKLIADYLEEKESNLNPTKINWDLLLLIYDLFLVAVESLECRRIMVKLQCWSTLAHTWHPMHFKKIIDRKQYSISVRITARRATLLSALTVHAEPFLPELTDSNVVRTLMDVAKARANPNVAKSALEILRNMSFTVGYRNALLTNHIVPFWVDFIIHSNRHLAVESKHITPATHQVAQNDNKCSRSSDETLTMAISSLISLAANNMRVKSEIRSLTEAWFQHNPPRIAQPATHFSHLYPILRKLIDL